MKNVFSDPLISFSPIDTFFGSNDCTSGSGDNNGCGPGSGKAGNGCPNGSDIPPK